MFSSSTLTLLLILTFISITFSCSSQLSFAQNTTSSSLLPAGSFVKSFEQLVNQAHNLTQSYQNEVTKWRTHQFDNKTMISIINDYIPKYENLVNQSKTLQPPKQFQNATNVYTKSLESELQSNVHFKNYVSTNNSTENKLSSQFLQEAANHEFDAFKALAPSGIFAFVPGR